VTAPTWFDLLDLDWEAELILIDADDSRNVCGTCGSGLNTAGLCPVCDYRRRW
jgi:hypothetical protein